MWMKDYNILTWGATSTQYYKYKGIITYIPFLGIYVYKTSIIFGAVLSKSKTRPTVILDTASIIVHAVPTLWSNFEHRRKRTKATRTACSRRNSSREKRNRRWSRRRCPQGERHLAQPTSNSSDHLGNGRTDRRTSGPCNFIVPGICMICIIKGPVLPDL